MTETKALPKKSNRMLKLIGQKHGRLTVIEQAGWYKGPKQKYRSSLWKCLCDCGNEKIVKGVSLLGNKVKSCGCYTVEKTKETNRLDGTEKAWRDYIAGYKKSAKLRNYDWKLTTNDVKSIASSSCFYCGMQPRLWECSKNRYIRICLKQKNPIDFEFAESKIIYVSGIDRLNNREGYVKNNVVACCSICNFAKSNLTETEWLTWTLRFGIKTMAVFGAHIQSELESLDNIQNGVSTEGRYPK